MRHVESPSHACSSPHSAYRAQFRKPRNQVLWGIDGSFNGLGRPRKFNALVKGIGHSTEVLAEMVRQIKRPRLPSDGVKMRTSIGDAICLEKLGRRPSFGATAFG